MNSNPTEVSPLPIFTTTEPAALGTHGKRNEEFVQKMLGLKHMEGFTHSEGKRKPVILYIHGQLQDNVGYDVPLWLSGVLVNKTHQRVRLYHPNGRRGWDAWLHIEEREQRYLGLIVQDLPAERKKAVTYFANSAY